MRADFADANQQLLMQKEAERLKDIEDDKKIAEFAKKKEQLETMKKECEAQRFADK